MQYTSIASTVSMLWLYPALLILCWLPSFAVTLYGDLGGFGSTSEGFQIAVTASYSLGSLYGVCLSAVYFGKSVDAHLLWKNYIFGEQHGMYHGQYIASSQVLLNEDDKGGGGYTDTDDNDGNSSRFASHSNSNAFISNESYSAEGRSDEEVMVCFVCLYACV